MLTDISWMFVLTNLSLADPINKGNKNKIMLRYQSLTILQMITI